MPQGVWLLAQLFKVPKIVLPAGSATVFIMAWPAAGPLTEKGVSIVKRRANLDGRTICQLARQVFAAGQHTLHWDGHSSAGSVAGAGTYFIAFRSGSEVVTQVVVKVE